VTAAAQDRRCRIAVLAGGLSLEREVSLRSGQRVADALVERGHEVARLDLDDHLVPRLADGAFDVAYLALHGKAGEDGTIQSLLELLGVRYTGPDAVASALAWDKTIAKGVFRRAGIPTPDWTALSSSAVRDMGAARALDRLAAQLGAPLIVKPAQGGASLGVRYVSSDAELAPALVASFSYHEVVLVERFVSGMEVAVSVIDGEPLPPVEVHPRVGTYDFAARYTAGATEFFAPARLAPDVLAACHETAVRAYAVAGCRHLTRADLIVDDDGVPWLLELDTCPGMTETSLLPIAAAAAGWSFADICERVVALALAPARAPSTP
jgi:D-alanine-D-alanine ligase